MRATEALYLSDPDNELTAEDAVLFTHLSLDRIVGPDGLNNRELVKRARQANRSRQKTLF